tara:strand:+ start:4369 stop:5616 length:1248 start_codon:yes stop_codon:yes gene_type:complete
MTAIKIILKKVSPERLFMGSVLLVNGGNYLYNLILGRLLGPAAFADAALLITLLLVLSFLGMTFQLATAKFAVLFSGHQWVAFQNLMYRYAMGFGIIVGIVLIAFSESLANVFQSESALMFKVFGAAIPFYFLMSVNRGTFQGRQDYSKLSVTYQAEMWTRLLITLALLLFVPLQPSLLVALGIVLSFIFGFFPTNFNLKTLFKSIRLSKIDQRKVSKFMLLTAGYELTQIIINNSDVLLVKHYFETFDAGLYASLALIGRVVYFVAWMFVMLLLPTVVQKQKDGEATAPILFKYVTYISILSFSIIAACYIFPELIIQIMFGELYLSIAPLLWKYAIATSLFAISNIFAYYFLSLDKYIPVIISGLLGFLQVILICFFHDSLQVVVQMQIIAMIVLLVSQLLYFIYSINKLSIK